MEGQIGWDRIIEDLGDSFILHVSEHFRGVACHSVKTSDHRIHVDE